MGKETSTTSSSPPPPVSQKRNDALQKAIDFSGKAVLANLIYFGWRIVLVFRSFFYESKVQAFAYLAFFIIEWTFTITNLLNALLLSSLGKKWTPQPAKRADLTQDLPLIDVFLPCYGESLEIIRDTVIASINQDYPSDKYRVVVLDDGNSRDVRDLIEKIAKEHPTARLHYATRGAVIKIHSKAANINFGLDLVKTFKDGPAPFFGVLDIDMIPTLPWLRATLPFLTEDPLVALAGSPQKFYNLPQGFSLASRYHLETDVMQRVFDANGKALCMGSGYLARRSIIDELGGFPAMVKQEDTFIVSIILQAHGYRVRLVEEEHQYGIYATTFTDLSKNMAKWMTGIIHAYSLFWHPIMSSKPLAAKIGGIFPILHLTVLRLFMMLSLPTILWLSGREVIPHASSTTLTVTLLLAAVAYSTMYLLSWSISQAAGGTVSLDDGQRLWHLPYQLKGVFWLAYHSLFGESKMRSFTTTGADVAASRKTARSGFLGRLRQTVFQDGAWMHMLYLTALLSALSHTLTRHHTSGTPPLVLLASVAFPPFVKIVAECLYQSFVPVLYCLAPDPNDLPRDALLQTDEKSGITQPRPAAVEPYRPPFWGTAANTGAMWLYFAAVPVARILGLA